MRQERVGIVRALATAIALVALASTAMAQQAPLTPEQTADALIHQAVEREIQATLQMTSLQRQVAQLQAQIAALTKERDDAKAAAKPSETKPTP